MIKQAKPRKTSPAQAAYEARVLEAYVALCLARRSPDVPVAELYWMVGGSFPRFARTLEACCRGGHAVPTAGEPVFATEFAKAHALSFDGERFLNIKFV